MFSESDLRLIQKRGSDPKEVSTQLENFKRGFPPLKLDRAAVIGTGILKLNGDQVNNYVDDFDKRLQNKKVIKFVPASGAASRMFKALFEFKSSYNGTESEYQKLVDEKGAVYSFFKNIENFAFYKDLKSAYAKNNDDTLEEAIIKKNYVAVLDAFLEDEGLGYGRLPKGLLKFHAYGGDSRTPVEEHIIEGINYARDESNNVVIHLTVSPEHKQKFQEHVATIKGSYEKQHGVNIHIQYSEQKASTDTIAVDMDNKPFIEENGEILFRPGGHGALIENLNDLDADIIFVKNIDNVVPDRIKADTHTYKKVLGSILLNYQDKIFGYLASLNDGSMNESLFKEVVDFIENELCLKLPEAFNSLSLEDRKRQIMKVLDRPIRVCGMVKNEGEPGGGPFWSTNSDASISLQIVESAQVDLKNENQKEIFQKSTHFNPVDLACGVKDYTGNKFNLTNFRDPSTGFIAYKSKGGRDLKAQELPGLWNGAMANWNTVFVEVPLITFNPVKQVTDLLKEKHQ